MQVNLRHHPRAFKNLTEAFDPRYNVAYAARFLRNNFEELGSWKLAAAAYHSRTPDRGSKYVKVVYRSWSRIVTKIAEARSGKTSPVAKSYAQAPAATFDNTAITADTPGFGSRSVKQQAKRVHKPVRMKIIELAKKDRALENGVIVIRPKHDADTADDAPVIQLASATPSAGKKDSHAAAGLTVLNDGQFSPRSRLVRVSASGSPANTARKTADAGNTSGAERKAPRFIFE